MGHIVVDADGEVAGALAGEVLVDREHHRRSELLAGESVTPADDGDVLAVGQRSLDIKEERLAERTGLLAAVEHRDLLRSRRNRLDENIGGERAIEADLQQTELFTLRIEVSDRLFDGFATGSHRHDDAVGWGLVEWYIMDKLWETRKKGKVTPSSKQEE